ncbi:MAG: hypothetical protein V4448_02115 [Pseudomonadota bacterium]
MIRISSAAALLGSLLGVVSIPTFAQGIIAADSVTAQALVGRDGNGFSSCGVRVLATVASMSSGEMYDFSVAVYRKNLMPLIKAGRYDLTKADIQKGVLPPAAVPAPSKFLLSSATQDATLEATNIMPAEDKGFSLGLADLAKTWLAITALADGENMHLVMRSPKQRWDRVVSFSAKLTEGEAKSLNSCLGSLVKDMEDLQKK